MIVHRHYPLLGEAAGAAEHQRDLAAFVVYRPELDRRFATFIATFQGPGLVAEVTFERLLWRHLQAMHDVDSGTQGWAAERTSTPHERGFAFCVAGHPFFVVGLHPGASRLSRRFEFCAVAFNSHEQFDLLYREGTFRKLRAAIRERQLALQGSINPNFVEYPDDEARHYAGRFTDPGWRCPFRPNV